MSPFLMVEIFSISNSVAMERSVEGDLAFSSPIEIVCSSVIESILSQDTEKIKIDFLRDYTPEGLWRLSVQRYNLYKAPFTFVIRIKSKKINYNKKNLVLSQLLLI